MVGALQTFGSQVQWNPHVHSLVTDGLLLPGGAYLPLPLWGTELEELLTETFRRLVLDALVDEERLSLEFMERLLTFRHGGGFSVYGRHLILNVEPARLAHMVRYAVRPPNKIPEPRSHQICSYGAYANRVRRRYRGETGEVAVRARADGDVVPLPKSRAS